MKNIYLLDIYEEHTSGFTTFKREWLEALSGYSHICLHHIIENYPVDEFNIVQEGEIRRIYIPYIERSKYRNAIIGTLLQQYISDSPETIFILNFSPAYRVLAMLKDYFPSCKAVYVIHDFIWASYVMGDVDKFKRIIKEGEQTEYSDIVCKAYKDNVKAFELANKIVCLSEDTYQLLNSFYEIHPSRLSLIPNGMKDYAALLSKTYKKENEIGKTLIAVGRVTLQKGMFDLLQCFQHVVKAIPDCRLVIAGDIKKQEINSFPHLVKQNVYFLGNIDHMTLYDWYRKADVGIILSYYEQCSYVGIEMKMFGIPVVASDGFGVRNMFNDNNAIVVSIGQRGSREYQIHLAESIIRMLSLPAEKLREYAMLSRKSYLQHYNQIGMRNKYLELIKNI